MSKTTIILDDKVHEEARRLGINISAVARAAVETEIEVVKAMKKLEAKVRADTARKALLK